MVIQKRFWEETSDILTFGYAEEVTVPHQLVTVFPAMIIVSDMLVVSVVIL